MRARWQLGCLMAWGLPMLVGAQAPTAAPKGAAKPAAKPGAKPAAAPATKSQAPLGPDGMRVGTDLAKVGDSIVQRTTWTPAGQLRFVAASRGKRLLLDMGRVDLDPRKDTARARAFRAVIPKAAVVPVGTAFTLRGPFGTIATRITGYDVWASRVVAVLELPAHVDSLAKKSDKLTAVAERSGGGVASAAPVAAASSPAGGTASSPSAPSVNAATTIATACVRDSLPRKPSARETFLKDSLDQVVRNTPRPAYTGVSRKVLTRATRVAGCFGIGQVALAVMLRDDRGEWFVERVVILDERERALPLKVSDLRFRGHELLGAYDADGDGIDELATRATTERAGAVTVLKLDAKGKKLERLAAGFAWEDL